MAKPCQQAVSDQKHDEQKGLPARPEPRTIYVAQTERRRDPFAEHRLRANQKSLMIPPFSQSP
jgi:hypothetical protein